MPPIPLRMDEDVLGGREESLHWRAGGALRVFRDDELSYGDLGDHCGEGGLVVAVRRRQHVPTIDEASAALPLPAAVHPVAESGEEGQLTVAGLTTAAHCEQVQVEAALARLGAGDPVAQGRRITHG